ncbi:hypothetical protein N0V93_010018 [Gnomoniopsis smithogilvyi]|uniref:Laccase n=1 Tax=Gnomoniopsis smithogilvyi TaxID=1191159 RepID=A0A9W8YJJ3_9PEZI|nr:hypothetical protein N0V93_010018 [Gnomoniopsis smithogilvyi]
MKVLQHFLTLATGSLALSIPSTNSRKSLERAAEADLLPRASCENSASDRSCWGDYSIDTNYYDVVPETGITREYWLNVEQVACAPDGYNTTCLTYNGTVPGPTLFADWGDTLKVHVTNNLIDNGTTIHWHGVRQLNTVAQDGVPGVTQCPLAPGESQTYEFQVSQYGSTWYHSHASLQYGQGLFGALILNGPATANYDEDLGALFLGDWHHTDVWDLWDESAKLGAPPTLDGGLINGTNTYNCSTTSDPTCTGVLGSKFEAVFESGTTYRIRLVNVAIDGHFQFSIDGHTLTVIGTDLVPIVPYETDSVLVSIGQRVDVLVEANAAAGDYWLRAGWVAACATINRADDITGIVRYDASSTSDPTSTSTVTASTSCGDEPYESIVPHLALDVGAFTSEADEVLSFAATASAFTWTINSSSLWLDMETPTIQTVLAGDSVFPTDYNVVAVDGSSASVSNSTTSANSTDEWALLVIQDATGFGLYHPIHLHGHDFWVVGQAVGTYVEGTTVLNTSNPPRRDVASLPGNGYLAIAFKVDNPGAWLVHCHIAWHASQGLSLEIVESESQISSVSVTSDEKTTLTDTCDAWTAFTKTSNFYTQDDSGI